LEPKGLGKMETFIVNILLEKLSTSPRFFISFFSFAIFKQNPYL
jgi:hypothetical protein